MKYNYVIKKVSNRDSITPKQSLEKLKPHFILLESSFNLPKPYFNLIKLHFNFRIMAC